MTPLGPRTERAIVKWWEPSFEFHPNVEVGDVETVLKRAKEEADCGFAVSVDVDFNAEMRRNSLGVT